MKNEEPDALKEIPVLGGMLTLLQRQWSVSGL